MELLRVAAALWHESTKQGEAAPHPAVYTLACAKVNAEVPQTQPLSAALAARLSAVVRWPLRADWHGTQL